MITRLYNRINRTERGASLLEYGLLVVAILVTSGEGASHTSLFR